LPIPSEGLIADRERIRRRRVQAEQKSMSETPVAATVRKRASLAVVPLALFAALIALFLVRLNANDASLLPSTLIGRAAPSLNLPGLDGGPGVGDADLRAGHVTLVNIFASWCEPCHLEHENLMTLARDPALKAKGVVLVGVAQRDSEGNIRKFLDELGDPFAKVGLDPDNRAGIDWGVYGVPETFVVRGDGVVTYKFIGPLGADAMKTVLKPQIELAAK
jgi:cytochrome c biogenesis protein CcmG, thiol:disulfide interchange protein DsbE